MTLKPKAKIDELCIYVILNIITEIHCNEQCELHCELSYNNKIIFIRELSIFMSLVCYLGVSLTVDLMQSSEAKPQ